MKIAKLLYTSSLLIVSVAIVFCVVEGASSFAFHIQKMLSFELIKETLHTQHDKKLGWSNIPNFYSKDFYGPNQSVTINSQGFRKSQDILKQIARGKIRIFCSGDSFTFGHSVGDKWPWCTQLSKVNESLETVNLGLGGYGVDQSYLRYLEEESKYDHDVHLFTFIHSDFNRMRTKKLFGIYDKPMLKVKDGELVAINTPVPKPANSTLRARQNLLYLARNLDSTKALYGLLRKLPGLRSWGELGEETFDDLKPTINLIFDNLKSKSEKNNSLLALVYLPRQTDIHTDWYDNFRDWLKNTAEEKDIFWIDLTDVLRNIPDERLDGYITGHYTEAGNALMAKALYHQLRKHPRFKELLEKS